MNEPIVELKDISFSYPGRRKRVFERFNVHFSEEMRIGLIGPNGCGKTTLFHLVMGILQPQKGKLFFRGSEITDKTGYKSLRKEIGLLFQDADDQLFSPSVLEDVAFGPLNLGMGKVKAREKAIATLDSLGLAGFADRITHKLSGGEKKLVSLATILAMEPRLLLLDEPTNNLDPDTRSRLIQILSDLPMGFVIISHDWDFLQDTCNDLYSLQTGEVTRCEKAHVHHHSHAHIHGEQPHRHGID